ncbi:MAG: MATE family efflux transporter [Clostridiales bacterium]|nr:MATE family efflux transporter [Clostridiales bacterium]
MYDRIIKLNAEKEEKEVEKAIKQNKMGTMPVGRLLFSMSLPMVISMLVQALYNVVDSVFVARIDTAIAANGVNNALTAVGLAYPIQFLMVAFAVGTAVGMNSLMSRRLGEKRHEEANSAASNGLFLEFVSAMVFLVLGLTCVRPFLKIFTSDAEVLDLGVSYLKICMVFCLGIFIHLGFDRILQSMGKTGLSMAAQLAGAVTNIVLDPLMIFGYWGFPKMGIAGAAAATVIGQWVSMIVAALLVVLGKHEIKVSFKHFKPSGESIKEIYRVGAPSIVMQGIGSVMNTGMNFVLSRFLTDGMGVAIMNIYYKMQSLIFMPMFGITNASMSIIAFNFGAKDYKRLMRTWRITLVVCIIIMSLGLLCFQIFPEPIVRIFDTDGAITGEGIRAFKTISLHFPIAAICIVCGTLFQATGRGFYSMIVSLMRQLVALLPAAAILALATGKLSAVWWSFIIAEFMSLAVSLICMKRLYKKELKPIKEMNT